MKIGLLGRGDLTGLGQMTREFIRHNHDRLDRIGFVMRGKDFVGTCDVALKDVRFYHDSLTRSAFSQFIDGLDVLIGFETLYCQEPIALCENRGVKVVMFPNWECSPPDMAAAHLVVSLSDQDAREYPESRQMDWPICLSEFYPREIEHPPRRVVHNSGWGGLHGRNNTRAILQAAGRLYCSGLPGIFCRSFEPQAKHRGVRWLAPELETGGLYDATDLLVHLQAFPGLSLPLLEAAACRIPALVLDLDGFHHYPDAQRVAVGHWETHQIGGRPIPYGRPDPDDLYTKLGNLMRGVVLAEPVACPPGWGEFNSQFWTLVESL
jgi:hypothetical protein